MKNSVSGVLSKKKTGIKRVCKLLTKLVIPECFYRESSTLPSLLNKNFLSVITTGVVDPRLRPSGMTSFYTGFTLIELLVVVLIIGILAAVALPQYQKAVLKARMAQLMVSTDALAKAQKVYFLANGEYADSVDKLDVEIPTKPGVRCLPIYGFGTHAHAAGCSLAGDIALFIDLDSDQRSCFSYPETHHIGRAFCEEWTGTTAYRSGCNNDCHIYNDD